MPRAKGYSYAIGKDGRRYRVYKKRQTIRGSGPYSIPQGDFDEGPSLRQRYLKSGFVKYMKKAVPKGSFESGGEMLAGPLGAFAGKKIAELVGFGEYRIKKNSLVLSEGNSPAYMHQSNSNAIIRHREYIQDIVSSATPNAFQNQVFAIQPGLNGSFPWLSALAQQYEQYRIKGMVYEFKSLYADAIASSAANATIGYVIMGTNYNSVYPPFINKQQMDNTDYTTSAKPSVSFYHPIECEPDSHPTQNLYIRSGDPPLNADLRMYDLGNFQIATGGIAAANVLVGELWCTYEVELIKPISTTAHGLNVLSDQLLLSDPANTTAVTFMGDSVTPTSGSSIGGKLVADSGTGEATYFFPTSIQDGDYLVVISIQATTPGAILGPTLALTNCTGMELYNNNSSIVVTAGETGAPVSSWMMSFVVNIDAPLGSPASIRFVGGASSMVGTSGTMFVTQLDADIQP